MPIRHKTEGNQDIFKGWRHFIATEELQRGDYIWHDKIKVQVYLKVHKVVREL